MILIAAVFGYGQMDMLPQLLRDLPPELQEGIPDKMTYEEYRQLNRNVDFFTMFMSMFVPGYGFFQVEKPGLAAGVIAGRAAGYGLMATGLIRQWDSMQDIGNASELSVGDFNHLLTNAALFGSGILLNGIGWALDVIGAYHIAKKEKDFVIYKYGLQKKIGGVGELNLISYIRKLQLQPEDKQAAQDLEHSLQRFVTLYPFSEYAAEAELYLALLSRRQNTIHQTGKKYSKPAEALLHAGRAVFLYSNNRYTESAKRLGWETISVRITDGDNPSRHLEMEIEENTHRKNLTTDELAEGYIRLKKLKHPGFFHRIWTAIKKKKKKIFGKRQI